MSIKDKNIAITQEEFDKFIEYAFKKGESWGVAYSTWFNPTEEDSKQKINDVISHINTSFVNKNNSLLEKHEPNSKTFPVETTHRLLEQNKVLKDIISSNFKSFFITGFSIGFDKGFNECEAQHKGISEGSNSEIIANRAFDNWLNNL